MDEYRQEVIVLLKQIRDMLEPIAEGSKNQFIEEKLRTLNKLITPKNRKVLPLLFDPRGLTQSQMADESGASQPTVSRLISDLKDANLIEEASIRGVSVYRDRFKLLDKVKD